MFYKRFLASPNFASWFERRRGAARAWQAAAWSDALLDRGEGEEPEVLDDVHLVEAFLRLETRLAEAEGVAARRNAPHGAATAVDALRRQAARAYAAMPRDLQAAVLSAPARAAVVQGLGHGARGVPGLPTRAASSDAEPKAGGAGG